jgi:sodium/pantothenate symporter
MSLALMTGVIVIYLALLFYSGRLGYKASESFSDYVAGSWNIGLWLLVGTFSATWVSAVSVMGFPGMLFGVGMAALTAVYAGYFMANTLMPILAYKLRRPEHPPATIPEYLRLRFEPFEKRSGLQVLGGVAMVLGYAVFVMIQVSAFGILFSTITGWPYLVCIFLFGAFILYIAAGGTLSVVISDLFNTCVILVGVILGALYILPRVGGWNAMWTSYGTMTAPALVGAEPAAAGALLSMLGPYSLSTVVGLFIASALGGSLAPHWPSRMLYARNVKTAIAMPMVSQLVICFVLYGALLVLGVGGRVLVGTLDAANTDWIMPYLFLNEIGGLLGAIGIAGLLAAAMSTSNSMLFHGALAVVFDVFRNLSSTRYPEAALQRLTKMTVLGVGIVSILLAINPPEFIAVMSARVFGFWCAAFFVPLYIGLYWKRLNRQAVYWSMTVAPLTFVVLEFLIGRGTVQGWLPAIVWAVLVAVGGSVALSFAYPGAPREGWEPFFEARVSESTARAWAAVRSGADLLDLERDLARKDVKISSGRSTSSASP